MFVFSLKSQDRPLMKTEVLIDFLSTTFVCSQPLFFTEHLLFLSVLENQILITLALETEGCGWGQGPMS